MSTATPDTVVLVTVSAPVPAREGASGAAVAPDDESGVEARCRICFGGAEDALPLVSLNCLCKGGLSQVHTQCAEAWFKRRGAVRKHTFFSRGGLASRVEEASPCVVCGVVLSHGPCRRRQRDL